MLYEPHEDRLNFIDLFAGAGGLSEGFIQAGFNPVAHVEMNAFAAETLRTRLAYHYLRVDENLEPYYAYERGGLAREDLFRLVPTMAYDSVLNAEMSDKTLPHIFDSIHGIMDREGINHIHVVIGGPPCQAYSLVGRAQSSHMRTPMEEDPRNELYKMYTRCLTEFHPDMFVFENVQGLITARGGSSFKNLQAQLKRVGYEIEVHKQNAYNFGVLQSRKRLIIIGWRKYSRHFYPDFVPIHYDALVNDVFADLPTVERGETNNHYAVPYEEASEYVRLTGLRTPEDVLTQNTVRPNKAQDVEIYRRTIQKWFEGSRHERLKYDELPDELKTHKNRTSFVDRFKVVEGDEPFCHTVLAHLSKDGHYFIHPDINQCRSISVREAARLQSFPDSYFFEGPRTSQFVQIGNAVPPMMAQRIADSIRNELEAG